MGDSQAPQHAPVSQSPLVAALSTPSTAQSHSDGPQFAAPPNGTPGPIRVNPIHIRSAPYPPGHVVRLNHPPGFNPAQQVVVQRPHSGHPQMIPQPIPINPGPPVGGAPSYVHLPQTPAGLIDKMRLDDLVKQIDPNTNLEDNVKEALIEYCDDFISEIITKVCNFATYRTGQQQAPNKKIEVRDVEMVLNMVYHMPVVPRAAVHVFGQPATQYPKLDAHPPTEAHKQRLLLIKKQIKKI